MSKVFDILHHFTTGLKPVPFPDSLQKKALALGQYVLITGVLVSTVQAVAALIFYDIGALFCHLIYSATCLAGAHFIKQHIEMRAFDESVDKLDSTSSNLRQTTTKTKNTTEKLSTTVNKMELLHGNEKGLISEFSKERKKSVDFCKTVQQTIRDIELTCLHLETKSTKLDSAKVEFQALTSTFQEIQKSMLLLSGVLEKKITKSTKNNELFSKTKNSFSKQAKDLQATIVKTHKEMVDIADHIEQSRGAFIKRLKKRNSALNKNMEGLKQILLRIQRESAALASLTQEAKALMPH